jgi:hypothetical protein
MGLQPFEWKTAWIVLISLGIWYVVSCIPVLGGSVWVSWVLNLAVRSAAVGFLFLLAGWVFNLSPDLTALIKSKISK